MSRKSTHVFDPDLLRTYGLRRSHISQYHCGWFLRWHYDGTLQSVTGTTVHAVAAEYLRRYSNLK